MVRLSNCKPENNLFTQEPGKPTQFRRQRAGKTKMPPQVAKKLGNDTNTGIIKQRA